ncbi:hypothetical protein H6G76_25855 [Nostoc sp. FACHB-152]|uniref:hypothetical protein n=1 Tax=Nostoc sp. FACHB-152 TaxID=2692837 RepID=UPI0016845F39|nr:hypothetical protein [Nostoc sp. FACHB-152]MBD2450516.1 hypothetical protein [Nostoc sp. FACHB-152]
MTKVWQFWEFEHPSNNTVRVIATPEGLEIFAKDVFQILIPELKQEKIIPLKIKSKKRSVVLNCNSGIVTIETLNSLAIYNLTSIVEPVLVRQFMQWVRSKVMPIFQQEFI